MRGVALAALVVSVTMGGAATAKAQGTERVVFLVRQGNDTLAVETAALSRGRAESSILFRMPVMRLRNVMTLSSSGELQRLETSAGRGVLGDSGVTRSVMVVKGDSAELQLEGAPGSPAMPMRKIPFARGAIPFVNLSGHTLEMILRRARSFRGDSVRVPLLLPTGQSLPMRVNFLGRDSAVISLAGIDIRTRTDAAGRLLGGVVPMQGVYFERLAPGSRAASWTPVPPSYDPPAGAPYTAEAMITGSGSQDRDAYIPAIGEYRPFRQIADTLSRRGIALIAGTAITFYREKPIVR